MGVGVKASNGLYVERQTFRKFYHCEYENKERVVVRFFVFDRSLDRVTLSRNIIYCNIYLFEKKNQKLVLWITALSIRKMLNVYIAEIENSE